jgi:DNA-3-methyladenine glycosylase II
MYYVVPVPRNTSRLPAVNLFGALVFQIIGQQISVIAATAIFARLTGRFGGRVPDAGRLSETELRDLPDQEVIRRLTEINGIGAWTGQGALLIALQRPDLIRADDLALRRAIQGWRPASSPRICE